MASHTRHTLVVTGLQALDFLSEIENCELDKTGAAAAAARRGRASCVWAALRPARRQQAASGAVTSQRLDSPARVCSLVLCRAVLLACGSASVLTTSTADMHTPRRLCVHDRRPHDGPQRRRPAAAAAADAARHEAAGAGGMRLRCEARCAARAHSGGVALHAHSCMHPHMPPPASTPPNPTPHKHTHTTHNPCQAFLASLQWFEGEALGRHASGPYLLGSEFSVLDIMVISSMERLAAGVPARVGACRRRVLLPRRNAT
jgi:hypothetical protein